MIHCYLDDSGTDKSTPQLTIAGYIASPDGWEKFEERSENFFRSTGFKKFHSKEFFDRKNDFKGWDTIKQTCFAWDWFEIASETLGRLEK